MADFTQFMMTDPMMQQGLAAMRGESPSAGLERARYAQTMMAEQQERQRAEQTRAALGQAMAGGITPEKINEIMAIDPEMGLKLLEHMRLQQKEEQRMQMMQQMFSGGSGMAGGTDTASKLAAFGAMTGDPTMLTAATFLQGQQEKTPEAIGQRELAKKKAVTDAENLATLDSLSNKLPSLIDTVNQLSDLSKTATYTEGGKALDWVARQTGVATPGAVARTNYESMVSNQVLPLLRDTFGSQFTEREGKRLQDTLGDPDKSPEEKNTVLQSFIRQKANDIKSLGRQYSRDTSFVEDMMKSVNIGNKPSGADTSKLRSQAMEALKSGASESAVRAKYKEMTGEDL